MQVADWFTMALGWLIAGPAFLAVFRALGLGYRVRPSVPMARRIPYPDRRERATTLPSRDDVMNPVRATAMAPAPSRPRFSPATYEKLWWDDGLRPAARSAREVAAGD